MKNYKKIVSYIRWKILKLVRLDFIKSAYGPYFHANYEDSTFEYYIRGNYGNYLAEYITLHKNQAIFIDVGANQGLYSIIAAKNKNFIKIYAFEPVQETFNLLIKNIDLNKVSKSVIPIKAAVDNSNKNKLINYSNVHSGGASFHHSFAHSKTYTVSCLDSDRLNELVSCEDHEVFVKIDTEGYEPIVINELRKTLFWKNITFIYFEVDNNWYDETDIIRTLKNDGFEEIYKTNQGASHFDIAMKRKYKI